MRLAEYGETNFLTTPDFVKCRTVGMILFIKMPFTRMCVFSRRFCLKWQNRMKIIFSFQIEPALELMIEAV